MARKRVIHPSYFTSATVNGWTIPAVILGAGILTYCDDYGRGENDVALIRAAIWPRRPSITDAKTRAQLQELADSGYLCRHTIAGYPLLHVTNWHEHQRVQHPTDSKLPPCPTHEPALFGLWATEDVPVEDKYRRGFVKSSGDVPDALQRNVIQYKSIEGKSRDLTPVGGPATACDHGCENWLRCGICRHALKAASK